MSPQILRFSSAPVGHAMVEKNISCLRSGCDQLPSETRECDFCGNLPERRTRSTDEGASWQPFSSGLTGLGATDIGNILIRRDSLIAGTLGAGVFATPVGISAAWSLLGDSLLDYQGHNVFKLAQVGNTLLAGAGSNGYMFRYADAQPWWNPIPMNTPRFVGQFVTGAASDGTTMVAATNTGIYRSSDQGLSWQTTNFSLPGPTIPTFMLFHGPAVFALSTSPFFSTLFRSSDVGASWQSVGAFPLPNVLDAAIVGDTLFLGGPGGLWKAPLSQLITSTDDRRLAPQAFSLNQNFPNPFNPSTVIGYELPVVSFVSLRIFDLLGQAVETLVNEELPAGTFKATWNASDYPSGVFFCRLEARRFVATRKLVLVR